MLLSLDMIAFTETLFLRSAVSMRSLCDDKRNLDVAILECSGITLSVSYMGLTLGEGLIAQ